MIYVTFRDEKVRSKILRIFKIWEQRSVYDDEFLSDLTGLLSAGAIKKTDDDPLDFQVKHFIISGSGVVGSNPRHGAVTIQNHMHL